MECPKCHKSGNVLRKVFGNENRKEGIKYCLYCGTRVKISYQWLRIFMLFLIVVVVVVAIHYALIYFFHEPGLTPILAGSIAAILILFIMQTKWFMQIKEL
jgi:hypothetical protein